MIFLLRNKLIRNLITIKIHLFIKVNKIKNIRSFKNKNKKFKIKILFYNCMRLKKQRKNARKIKKMII